MQMDMEIMNHEQKTDSQENRSPYTATMGRFSQQEDESPSSNFHSLTDFEQFLGTADQSFPSRSIFTLSV